MLESTPLCSARPFGTSTLLIALAFCVCIVATALPTKAAPTAPDGLPGADGLDQPGALPGEDGLTGGDAGDGGNGTNGTAGMSGGFASGDLSLLTGLAGCEAGAGGAGGTGGNGGNGGVGFGEIGGVGGDGGAGGTGGAGGIGGDGGGLSVIGVSTLSGLLDLSGGQGGAGGAAGAGGGSGNGGEDVIGNAGVAANGSSGASGSQGNGSAGGNGGNLLLQGDLSLSGTVDLSGGLGGSGTTDGIQGYGGTLTVDLGGKLTLLEGALIDLQGSSDGSLILDGGTLVLEDEATLFFAMPEGALGIETGTIEFTGDQVSVGTLGSNGAIGQALGYDDGHMRLLEGQSIVAANAIAFYNRPFTVDGGSVRATSINTTGTTFTLANGGRLETTFVVGNLTNAGGVFAPGASPAASVVLGDYNQSSGSLEMELGGTGVGEYDSLFVSGNFNIGGDLDVVWYDGFTADKADVFALLGWDPGSSAGPVGTFANVNLPGLSNDLEWDTSKLYSDGSIAVIPEPSAALLLSLAGIAALARRRRG